MCSGKESCSYPCQGVCSSLAGSGVRCPPYKTQESAASGDSCHEKPGLCLAEGLVEVCASQGGG